MSKLLFLDVETTGLNAAVNGIVQLSGIIEIDGEVKEAFDYRLKPFPEDEISDEALVVSGITREELTTYEEPHKIYKKLKELLSKYVNPYDRLSERFIAVGYNFQFDYDFLNSFFVKNLELNAEVDRELGQLFEALYGSELNEQNIEWLKQFFIKNGDNFFNSFVRNIIDIRQLYTLYCMKKDISTHNTRLQDACDMIGVKLTNAHDAKADIIATRALYKKLDKEISFNE
jgi:DNA polymerase-3 subunit epsilon